ncbi:MAG: hypothetical protein ACXABY_04615, partial [Candidatus Thorarchaeota archaeon]
ERCNFGWTLRVCTKRPTSGFFSTPNYTYESQSIMYVYSTGIYARDEPKQELKISESNPRMTEVLISEVIDFLTED